MPSRPASLSCQLSLQPLRRYPPATAPERFDEPKSLIGGQGGYRAGMFPNILARVLVKRNERRRGLGSQA